MKKCIKAVFIAVAATLSLCACVLFSACGKQDVVFTDRRAAFNIEASFTLTLKGDSDKFELVASANGAVSDSTRESLKKLYRSGTYSFEDNKYTLVFKEDGKKDETVTSSYESVTKTHTVKYSLKTDDTTVSLQLKYQEP